MKRGIDVAERVCEVRAEAMGESDDAAVVTLGGLC